VTIALVIREVFHRICRGVWWSKFS